MSVQKRLFSRFLNIYKFDDVIINLVSIKYYCEYFLQFGNIDECLRPQPEYFEELSSDNVIDRFQHIYKNLIKPQEEK